MDFITLPTQDGSVTLHHTETGEHYHNRAGAYTEALLNYVVPSGALEIVKKTGRLRVLDACYGLGYNSWTLAQYLLQSLSDHPFVLEITAIETNRTLEAFIPTLLAQPCFELLRCHCEERSDVAISRASTIWRLPRAFGPRNDIVLELGTDQRVLIHFLWDDLRKVLPTLEGPYELVFHDPFSPTKMPELWTCDLFKQYQRLLTPSQGSVLTYSIAGSVRGGLQEAGFQVAKTQPVGEKPGGTVAYLDSKAFSGNWIQLDENERAYMESCAGIPFRDSALSTTREAIIAARKQEQAQSSRLSGESIRKKIHNL